MNVNDFRKWVKIMNFYEFLNVKSRTFIHYANKLRPNGTV